MTFRRYLLAFVLTAASVAAQPLNQTSLSGRYGFVHLLTNVSNTGQVQSARNLGGIITFDSTGSYTFQGELGNDSGAGSPITGSGSYSVAPNGFVRLTNPIVGSLVLNCRLGVGAEALLGASTEGTTGVYDFFAAIRLGAAGASNSTLSGSYVGSALALPNGATTAAKTGLLTMTPNGQGGFTNFGVDGHAANQGDTPLAENISTASYSVNADGSGSLTIGQDSTLLAVRQVSGFASDADFAGNFWMVDFNVNSAFNSVESGVSGIRSDGAGTVSIAQRLALIQGTNFRGILDFSGVNSYGITASGTGFLRGIPQPGVTNFALGAPATASLTQEGAGQLNAGPNAFVGAQVLQSQPSYEVHGLTFGIRLPAMDGTGAPVFLSPIGVLNAASFAPPTAPISGGTLLSLFGSGLANTTAEAGSVPLPTQLGGVTVTVNGVPAPLFFVSPGQVNIQTPFGVQGQTATIAVTNGGNTSNSVEVPVAASSPGIFSVQQTGFGPGSITDADFQLINEQNPAAPGEVVSIFLTGAGPLSPAFPDGAPGPTDPLSRTTDAALQVQFDGEAGDIQFSGAAPGFVGLYQINVRVPEATFVGPAVAVAILTSNAFSDYVDIAVGF